MITQADKIEKLQDQAEDGEHRHDKAEDRLLRIETKQEVHESNDKGRHDIIQAAVADVKKAVESLDNRMFKLIIALILALTGIKGLEMANSPVAAALAAEQAHETFIQEADDSETDE